MPAPRIAEPMGPFDVSSSPFDCSRVGSIISYETGSGSAGARSATTSSVSGGMAPPPQPKEDIHNERVRYFVITSNTKENVVKSVRTGLWATQRKNEASLETAFRTASAVILVFSVNRSDAFQGYARMRSPIGRPTRGPDPFHGFGRLFDVEWLRLHDLPYREVDTLRNPMNGDRGVAFSRDGQELTNSVGRRLCGLIDRHIDDPGSFQQAVPQHPQMSSSGQSPFAAGTPPPALAPAMALPAQTSPSDDESDGARKKRRKTMRRRLRHPPHPLETTFDEQLEFFLDMDYDDYVQWFQKYGAVSPGPNLPQGSGSVSPPASGYPNHNFSAAHPAPPPPPHMLHGYGSPPLHGYGSRIHQLAFAPPPHAGLVPPPPGMFAAHPGHVPMMPAQPHHMGLAPPPHLMHPHMVLMRMQ